MRSKFFAFAALIAWCMPPLAQACAIAPFTPPEVTVQPTGHTNILVRWDHGVTQQGNVAIAPKSGRETLVIAPELRGNAADFGLVFGFPARPELSEPPTELFATLATMTRPLPPPVQFGGLFDGATATAPPSTTAPEVAVTEERVIGDLQITVLTAKNGRALEEWLRARTYVVDAQDRANIAYYLNRRNLERFSRAPDPHFVAIQLTAKARAAAQNELTDDEIEPSEQPLAPYDIRPIGFTFSTNMPFLPIRFAADGDPTQPVTLYTISSSPLIIPGAGLAFHGRLGMEVREPSHALARLAQPGDRLLRLELRIDPRRITRDPELVPQWTISKEIRPTVGDALLILAPESTPIDAGIVRPAPGELRAIDDAPAIADPPPPPAAPPTSTRHWPFFAAQQMLRLPLLLFFAAPFVGE
ncbi:DUF2330 domain-containing protein [Candidatus Uhrbacteria bacterium]|nr:DUF2330 domain-containing protein [Candidatus Uhrbacteria bacterium]